jgi:hypothetical protein
MALASADQMGGAASSRWCSIGRGALLTFVVVRFGLLTLAVAHFSSVVSAVPFRLDLCSGGDTIDGRWAADGADAVRFPRRERASRLRTSGDQTNQRYASRAFAASEMTGRRTALVRHGHGRCGGHGGCQRHICGHRRSLHPGSVAAGRYRLVALPGAADGRVCIARTTSPSQPVALKFLPRVDGMAEHHDTPKLDGSQRRHRPPVSLSICRLPAAATPAAASSAMEYVDGEISRRCSGIGRTPGTGDQIAQRLVADGARTNAACCIATEPASE